MNVDAVSFLPPQVMPSLAAPGETGADAGFAAWFGKQLGNLDGELQGAERAVQELAAGSATNLHQVMMQLEQAKLSLQLVVQVRNHLLDAYQDVIRMQV